MRVQVSKIVGYLPRSLLLCIQCLLLVACASPSAQPLTQTDSTAPSVAEENTTAEDAAVATTSNTTTQPDSDVTRTALQRTTPTVTHGPISGESTDTTLVLWARGNITGTLTFDISTTEDFAAPLQTAQVDIEAATDFTGEARIEGLEASQDYFYRATLTADGAESEPVSGVSRTAPSPDNAAAFRFAFGACLGGQNYCRPPDTGWTIFERIEAEEPDFFLFTGDSVYVDTACTGDENVAGAEGPYTDLEGFRTRYRYHLEDPIYANFLAQTPVYVTWDDHEVINDFGGPALEQINPQLFQDGLQAYFEYWPISAPADDPPRIYRSVSYGAQADFFILDTRSYRDPNVNWDPNPNTVEPKTMLGAEQFAWLNEQLRQSEATWKFIVTSVPLSYPTGFPQPAVDGRDGWADYTERSGYETELMALLFAIEQQDITNVIFLAGDTHWPYAISYDPDRDGTPNFHEFGSSPLSAIPLAPPETPDPTFNPEVLYAEGEFQGDLFNFGHIAVEEDGTLTFRAMDGDGNERYALTIQPE